jgi:SAM-dependent methyltransferase
MSSLASWLRRKLTIPALRGLDVDDPRLTALRRRVIREHALLRRIYETWYDLLAASLPDGSGAVLELGSGGGFLPERVPGVIASEIFPVPGIQAVLDGRRLPFRRACLRAICMVDVLHHIPDVRAFLAEAARCLRPGGVVTMVEPWVTPWSRLVYGRLHSEPFLPEAPDWEFPSTGPLSGANGALPWIVFQRDRQAFEREFPHWEAAAIRPMLPFVYLASGGVSLRPLAPGWTWSLWRALDRLFPPDRWGMFALVTLRRRQ